MKVLRPASNYKKMLPEHFYLVTFKRSFGFCLKNICPNEDVTTSKLKSTKLFKPVLTKTDAPPNSINL